MRPSDEPCIMRTHVALLTTASGLQPKARALCLDVAYSTTGIALLRGNRAGRRARRRFMTRQAAIVAETLLRRAIFRNMSHCTN